MTTTTADPAESRRIGGEPSRSVAPWKRDGDMPDPLPGWYIRKRQEYEARILQLELKVQELETAIVKAANANRQERENALTLYGRPNSVQELIQAIKISPKFADLDAGEHEFVARVGLATGLNPEFELHAWKDKGKLVVMPDYKGLMRNADRRYLMLKERRLTADELRERGVPEQAITEGTIGYLVEGYELDKAKYCKEAGIEYEPLRGYGIWEAKKDEVTWSNGPNGRRVRNVTGKRIDNDVPNGRDGAWVAWKRAIRALFNQISDLSLKFNVPVTGARLEDEDTFVFEPSAPPQVIEGQFTVAHDEHGEVFTFPPAAWTQDQAAVERMESWFSNHGFTEDAFNEYLGHDWRKSHLEQDEMRDKCRWYMQDQGDDMGLTEPEAPPTPTPEPEASADPTPADPEPEPAPRKGKKAPAVVMCSNCGIDPADPGNPFNPTLCATCASKLADKAAK